MYDALRAALAEGGYTVVEAFGLPARPAEYATVPTFLHQSRVGGHLEQQRSRLWCRQARALAALGQGENVVLSTGTASGKSLVFQAFTLHRVLSDPSRRVIVFYPLKALAADQVERWQDIAKSLGLPDDSIGRIDGSVPPPDRDRILQTARILVMTPDVCHAWLMSRLSMPIVKKFVDALAVLVLDEAHTLEGVFGSNFAFFDAMAELGGDTPQRNYPLRNVGEFNFQIKLNENAESFGEMTQAQALREAYPGAVYLHMARKYEVAAWHTTAFPFIRVKPTAPTRSTRPCITTWINASLTSSGLIDGHLLKGKNGFLAECQMQITERVDGFIDGNGREHKYQELRQRNPNLRSRSRNFRTSGVVLCINEPWFKREASRRRIADSLRDVFVHEYSVLPQDVGSVATRISVRGVENVKPQGCCVAVFDEVYGSLRLTEGLFLEFGHILDRLLVAANSIGNSSDAQEFTSLVTRIQKSVSTFAGGVGGNDAAEGAPEGYEQVFTKGSRVCARQKGQIAEDVEVIQPTLMNGQLMYQVATSPRPGRPPLRRWISASEVEPSGEDWNYAWWNRRTEEYEDPPDAES